MTFSIPTEALLALGLLELSVLFGVLVWFVRRQWSAWRVRCKVNQRLEDLKGQRWVDDNPEAMARLERLGARLRELRVA